MVLILIAFSWFIPPFLISWKLSQHTYTTAIILKPTEKLPKALIDGDRCKG